jgi:hypothetical protein
LLLGNSNATHPQVAPAADATRAERELNLQRAKTEFVVDQWMSREREQFEGKWGKWNAFIGLGQQPNFCDHFSRFSNHDI